MHALKCIKTHTLNKTLLVLKMPLDLNLVLLLQTNTPTHLNLKYNCLVVDSKALRVMLRQRSKDSRIILCTQEALKKYYIVTLKCERCLKYGWYKVWCICYIHYNGTICSFIFLFADFVSWGEVTAQLVLVVCQSCSPNELTCLDTSLISPYLLGDKRNAVLITPSSAV